MTPTRKKPGLAFWATVVVVVALVAYPLSFGPACWIKADDPKKAATLSRIYLPIGAAIIGRGWICRIMFAYGTLGMRPNTQVYVPVESHGYWPLIRE